MNKPFGMQGEIQNYPYKEFTEVSYDQDGIKIEVKDSLMIIGVDEEEKLVDAKMIADLLIILWSKSENRKLKVNYNQKWSLNDQNERVTRLLLIDSVHLSDKVETVLRQVDIYGKSSIIRSEKDGASFKNHLALLMKAKKHTALKDALLYFSDEVIDVEKPLYGIYKAIEAMYQYFSKDDKKKLWAITQLAAIINENPDYVKEILSSTHETRHHDPRKKAIIQDSDCIERTKRLIDAFANFLD